MTSGFPFFRGRIVLFVILSVLFFGLLAACTPNFRPSGWAGATTMDNVLYVGVGNGRIAAMEKLDGKLIWAFPANMKEKGIQIPGAIYATPALSADRVYVGDANGTVFALNRTNGQKVWDYCVTTGQPGPCMTKAPSGIVGHLVLADTLLLVPSNDGKLHALAITEESGVGRTKWTATTSNKVWSTPTVDNGTVYFGSHDHNVYAVSLENGQQVWTFATKGSVVAHPLVLNGTVYVGSFDRRLYALDAKTGAKKWEHEADNWFWADPTTDGTNVYAGTLGGDLIALDQTGKALWMVETHKKIVAPLTVLRKSLIVPTDDSYFRVFSTVDGREQWAYPLEATVRSQPAISEQDGVVYVVNAKNQIRALNALRATTSWGPVTIPE